MSVAGTWNLTIATPVGEQRTTVELTGEGADLRGVARLDGGDVALKEVALRGERLTWKHSITRPLRLSIAFDVVVRGDEMEGSSKAGVFPRSRVTGRRVAPAQPVL
ncbi:hypothetical protein [Kineococcus indalonis]|uniref:hypothetical protein n=1 Tax=Kineococcus indalonis TaxID=2696566 RepID=UPI001412D14E|nr:hypothetical protein [Kineococcus indalonis]NAZ86962.1 hypothetical protein [Kineococcus indalonis]